MTSRTKVLLALAVAVVIATWVFGDKTASLPATNGGDPAKSPASPERYRAPILAALRDPKLAFAENPAYVLDNPAFLDRAVEKVARQGDFFWHDRAEVTAQDAESYARSEIEAYQATSEGLAELVAKIRNRFANPEVEERRVDYPGRQLNAIDRTLNKGIGAASRAASGNPNAGKDPAIKPGAPYSEMRVTARYGLLPARLTMASRYGVRSPSRGVAHDKSDTAWFESAATDPDALCPRSSAVAKIVLALIQSHPGAQRLIATVETMPYPNRRQLWNYEIVPGESLSVLVSWESQGVLHGQRCPSQWAVEKLTALAEGGLG